LKEKAGFTPAFFMVAIRCRCLAQKLCARIDAAAAQLNTSCFASKMSARRRFMRGRSIRRRRMASLLRSATGTFFQSVYRQGSECYLSSKHRYSSLIWQLRHIGRRLLIVRRRCSFALIAGIEPASAGFSLKIRRCLAPQGQQAAMRGLRLSLSWSLTDKVS
jgi:hypothetical protein